jgi:hypothetical protein
VLLYAAALGTLGYFAWTGWSYYASPLAERARHPRYWDLKPAGTLGLRFGIAGATMMTLMLGYSLRKRLSWLHRWGPTSYWLDYHILLGVAGPLFIVLHSSFKVRGLVALSFWSMVAVALSGVVGRFLYRQIPHAQSGEELTRAEAEQVEHDLARSLAADFGLAPAALAELDRLVDDEAAAERSLFALMLRRPLDQLLLRRRLRRFQRAHGEIPGPLGSRFVHLARKKAQLRLRLATWQRLRRLFHHWHVFHKPFAVILYVFMVVHVAVAWVTGYGWTPR